MSNHTLINHLDRAFAGTLANDVRLGLSGDPKYLPCKYLYDAKGSHLFEKICLLDEYYPTRTEHSIIQMMAAEYMKESAECDIIELGSGSHEKISLFFDAAPSDLLKTLRYVPVDISEEAVESAMETLEKKYPDLPVMGIIADFTHHMEQVVTDRPSRYLFLGSTIGNFEEDASREFLTELAENLKEDDRLLIGFDMVKEKDTLLRAYNDSRGVTALFNLNLLEVLNRELDADFAPGLFTHRAVYNEENNRIEMYLVADSDMTVNIENIGLTVQFREGETIHTENSHKYTPDTIESMAGDSGLYILRSWTDNRNWFSLVEMKAGE